MKTPLIKIILFALLAALYGQVMSNVGAMNVCESISNGTYKWKVLGGECTVITECKQSVYVTRDENGTCKIDRVENN